MSTLQIIVEFVGGPLDGTTVSGILGEDGDAEQYYLLTNHGAIGQRIKLASDYAVETLASEQRKLATFLYVLSAMNRSSFS